MIVDHLFLFTDEATAITALEPYGFRTPEIDGVPEGWDYSRVLPCRVIMGWELGSYIDDNDELFTFDIPVYMSGYHINVALPDINNDLIEMEECVLITDREAGSVEGAAREDFVIHTKVSPETMDAVQGVTPVFAGSVYPFG